MAQSNSKQPLILLTNDDGFYSSGIQVLRKKLESIGKVTVVAPDNEKSATSLALTLHHPLRVKKIDASTYAVSGTPADCIYLAVQNILPSRPDFIFSGMNPGPNLGQQDISYSGTVAGALQGTFLDIPSIAVSTLPDGKGRFHFDFAADFILSLTKRMIPDFFPRGITININIPAPPVQGVKLTKLGQKRYNPEIIIKKDPRERDYFWIGTGTPRAIGDKDSDVQIIQQRFITVTPLHRDMTDYKILKNNQFQSMFQETEYEFS
ncbi:MAG: 5'/3'-nucleotidase SurE [Candidatus Aminicenantes bacterium]|nr:5'/3'-nucleotidase SurE [Candidatus Aminicenantes bacterium]